MHLNVWFYPTNSGKLQNVQLRVANLIFCFIKKNQLNSCNVIPVINKSPCCLISDLPEAVEMWLSLTAAD